MLTPKEIKDWKEYMTTTRCGQKIINQREDLEFFNDDYKLPLCKSTQVDYQIRPFSVARMINGIIQQLFGDKPRVYATPKKDTDQSRNGTGKVASKGNEWMNNVIKHSTNPVKETGKNLMTLGEACIYAVHNDTLAKWVDGDWKDVMPYAMPVRFIPYDPTIVYIDPAEEIDGKPKRALVFYKRTASSIRATYKWKSDAKDDELIDFLFYMDKDQFYSEAGAGDKSRPLFNRKNPYGFVPMAHFYSGWGKTTPGLDPDLLAFSRIRMIKDGVVEYSTMHSDTYYMLHRYGHRHRTYYYPQGAEIGDDTFANFKPDPDKISTIAVPEGADPTWFKADEALLPEREAFAYIDRLGANLAMEYPLPMQGVASGTSGRQEDILSGMGLSLYDCIIENNNKLWACVLDMAFKICGGMEEIMPPKLSKEDTESYSEITVDLKKENPIELSRQTSVGFNLWRGGAIDHKTFLIDYMHKTEEEAEDIINQSAIDIVMKNHPAIQQLILETIGEEMGQEERLAQLQAEMGEAAGVNPTVNYGKEGGQPRNMNVKTEAGAEMGDLATAHEPRLI